MTDRADQADSMTNPSQLLFPLRCRNCSGKLFKRSFVRSATHPAAAQRNYKSCDIRIGISHFGFEAMEPGTEAEHAGEGNIRILVPTSKLRGTLERARVCMCVRVCVRYVDIFLQGPLCMRS